MGETDCGVIWMMLLKCCIHHASKFGNLSSDHRTGWGQFSFQSSKKKKSNAIACSNYRTIALLTCKQSNVQNSQPGSNSSWTKNFQIVKLDLQKGEEPEINCQHPLDHWKTRRVSEKHLPLLYWLCQAFTVWITTNCGKFLKRWEYQATFPVSWEIYMQVKK